MPHGFVSIDAGAEKSLLEGRSLLPVGIVSVEGTFERGDAVVVKNHQGRDLAKGLVAYSSIEVLQIKGRRSEETELILGYRDRDEVIHRDNLVLIGH